MKPIIEIKNLSAGYDGRTVLHDVNLNVYERDFLGIIGPNGGGKTTLIKCILGLLKPTGGEIILHIPAPVQHHRQKISYFGGRSDPVRIEHTKVSHLPIHFRTERERQTDYLPYGTGRARTPFYRTIKRRTTATCLAGTGYYLRPCGIDSR